MWVVRNGLPRASAAVVLAALVLAALVLAAFVLSDAALPTVRVSLCDKACCLHTHISLGHAIRSGLTLKHLLRNLSRVKLSFGLKLVQNMLVLLSRKVVVAVAPDRDDRES